MSVVSLRERENPSVTDKNIKMKFINFNDALTNNREGASYNFFLLIGCK